MNEELLRQQLTRDEGVRLKPYRCTAGKLSIGIGRNLDDVGVSPSEAEYMLHNDILGVQVDLDRNLPWWRDLSENRQLVLCNMAFNMGIQGLLGFKNTLAAMQRGDIEAAASGMGSSKWAVQVGPRATRLIKQWRDG
ncbi:MAG TPA: glycoside hydrolase family protein [Acidiferrobacterales bacterium]|nr:glycoside hydrolase family protein [Acidiferrobacterales bacterium]